MVEVRRVYAKPSARDGVRILVDRLWPRGMSRRKARVDVWMRDVAPSDALRKWFSHDPRRWSAFQKKYRAELAAERETLAKLRAVARKKKVTLLFAAKDEKRNNAVALKKLLS